METSVIIAIVATGLFFLVTFATGGLLTYARTAGKPVNGVVVNIHKFLSILTVIATAATIYMLANGR